ncbi:hypothetical protein C8Q74DRAFT_666871 [Fomes fomentarius]|nr:hypothetical protein C8Q74DRAFT_666871 [Fomes fomentarius]
MIYGLNVHVTYLYYVSYPDDSTVLKAFVAIMFFSITVFGIATTHLSYHGLVTAAYPSPEASGLQPLWNLQIVPLSAAVTIFLVQGFYARRIFLFSRRARVMVIATVLVMIAGLDMSQWKRFTGFDSIILALFVAGDVLLTSTLVFLLGHSRTVFKRSNMVINTLIAYAVVGTSLMR